VHVKQATHAIWKRKLVSIALKTITGQERNCRSNLAQMHLFLWLEVLRKQIVSASLATLALTEGPANHAATQSGKP